MNERATYDLVVIGGGINGAGIAWEAALRGMRVALLEKADFGSGASSGCFKIVHGGVRYLQHLDLPRLLESVREQKNLRRIAGHLVQPLPFLVPCYGWGKRGVPFLAAGMTFYDLLAARRNAGLDSESYLPGYRILTAEQVRQSVPGLSSSRLTGGVVYHDALMHHCERLTYAVARSAQEAGADIFNYCEVVDADIHEETGQKAIRSLTFHNKRTGLNEVITGRYVVNATGQWAAGVMPSLGARDEFSRRKFFSSVGIQAIVEGMTSKYAVALESRYVDGASLLQRGGRSYFTVPWQGATLVGTSDRVVDVDPDNYCVERHEVDDFVAEVQALLPGSNISKENVSFVFGGLRLVDEAIWQGLCRGDGFSDGNAAVARDHLVVDHAAQDKSSVTNLLSVFAVKYTTFRVLAEQVVDLLVVREKRAGRKYGKSRSATTPLYGSVQGLTKTTAGIFPPAAINRLWRDYGSVAENIVALAVKEPRLQATLCGTDYTAAEIIYLTRCEDVYSAADIIFRRTLAGLPRQPDTGFVEEIVALVASELGKDAAWRESERESIAERYTCFPMKLR
ncbi:MAG: glycerol-3-phosphate dehydrogenase/oxidase [bacterium]|nr:glycerol-3-phosphate dehydrogenase/oxidase [bacterium]